MSGTDINEVTAPFKPTGDNAQSCTTVVTAGTSSQTCPLVAPPSAQAFAYKRQFQVYNSNTVPVFVGFGKTAAIAGAVTVPGNTTATAGGYPVAPGAVVVMTVEGNPQYAGVISAAAAGAGVYFTPGTGN